MDRGGPNPVTPKLIAVLTYNPGVNANDTSLKTTFPYEQTPWPGSCNCAGMEYDYIQPSLLPPSTRLNVGAPEVFLSSAPNPFVENTSVRYILQTASNVSIEVYDQRGHRISILVPPTQQQPGIYSVPFNTATLSKGVYFVKAIKNGEVMQSLRIVKQ